MPLFKRRSDPIDERARALQAEIAALETQIRKLNTKASEEVHPKIRSTTLPDSGHHSPRPAPQPKETVFEEVDQRPLETDPAALATPLHFNELGVRKYDLVAFFRRLQNHFRTKPVSNPKLVSYLAAGSIQGLRPLRYEKRVARNRVIFLSVILTVVLLIIVSVFLNRR
jgi:hypothetical protein